jgi:hypothetical protein
MGGSGVKGQGARQSKASGRKQFFLEKKNQKLFRV